MPRARVYAIPVGVPRDPHDREHLVEHRLGSEDVVLLGLPAAGEWHVGVRTDQGHAVETIEVTEGAVVDLELRLPEIDPIEVLFEPALPPELLAYGPVKLQAKVDVENSVFFPRPGERTQLEHTVLVRNGDPVEIPAVRGADYQVTLRLPFEHEKARRAAYRATDLPAVFDIETPRHAAVAGTQIRFRVVGLGRVRTAWDVLRPDTCPNACAGVWLESATNKKYLGTCTKHMKPGLVSHQLIPAGVWDVVMDGGLVKFRRDPGPVAVRAGETALLALHIEFDAAWKPPVRSHPTRAPDPEPWPGADVRVEIDRPRDVPEDRDVTYGLVVFGVDMEGTRQTRGGSTEVDAEEETTTVQLESTVEHLYVGMLPWHACRSGEASRVVRVTPAPAGYLLVTPDQPIPQQLGDLHLSLRDGGLLPRTTIDEDGEHDFEDAKLRQKVESGTTLGPLPAGTYEFDVWLGGAHVRRITAQVIARRIVPLTIRSGD